jgi:hypothetical protein
VEKELDTLGRRVEAGRDPLVVPTAELVALAAQALDIR